MPKKKVPTSGSVSVIPHETEVVPIDQVQPHPKNARQGDVGAISESIRLNGMYRPLIAQRGSGYVLAGNHTWKALKAMGATEVEVRFLDVDDDAALRILLVDNRSNDLATYDNTAITELLRDLVDSPRGLQGTGYDGDELDRLVRDTATVLNFAAQSPKLEPRAVVMDRVDSPTLAAPPFTPMSNLRVRMTPEYQDLRLRLEGMAQNSYTDDDPAWGIASLRSDMLVESLERPILTWLGDHVVGDPTVAGTWFLNYGHVGSTDKMPPERALLTFFTPDEFIEPWWNDPPEKVATMLLRGMRMAIAPDFSKGVDMPRAYHLYQQYRQQWLGRYMQEAGIKVIPVFRPCPEDPEALRIALMGLPMEPPIMAVSMQIGTQERKDDDPLALDRYAQLVALACKHLRPTTLLAYGSGTAQDILQKADLSCDLILVEPFMSAKRRMQKETHGAA